jgi:sugar lactone lactonase YvrE
MRRCVWNCGSTNPVEAKNLEPETNARVEADWEEERDQNQNEICQMRTQVASLALRTEAVLGEGALWDNARARLLWVDIVQMRVGLFDPVSGVNQTLQLDSKVGTVVPTSRGDLLVAVQEGVARLDPRTGQLSGLRRPVDHDGRRIRFNDGKCDPQGRFWAGSMALDQSPKAAALYCFTADGAVTTAVRDVSISNGIVWSHDQRRMYYIDTPTRRIDVFDFDASTGQISKRRPAFVVPTEMGYPDGMTIDAEGMLWVALWGGSAVTRWDPQTGSLLEKVSVPTAHVTSCAFGGPELQSLFITTAREGLSAQQLIEQPLAGSLFVATPGVAGRPAFVYQG